MASSVDHAVDSFQKMGLKPELLRGIADYGLTSPSALQQRAIVSVVNGKDVIVQAPFGKDTIAALSIPILQRLDLSIKSTQALILSPTRESAQDIAQAIGGLGCHMNIECMALVGGTSVRESMGKLTEGVQVLVGTPGRVYDMFNRHAIHADTIKLVCLDEADDMLARGFREQIDEILPLLSHPQAVVFSASLPQPVMELTARLMGDPVRIFDKQITLTLESVNQFHIAVEKEEWKLDTLSDLYETVNSQAIVFCNTRERVDWLVQQLASRELIATALHADMEPAQLEKLVNDFRARSVRVLITSAPVPGVDMSQVQLLINYDLPSTREGYLGRVGRDEQSDRRGFAISIVTSGEMDKLKDIEGAYNTRIEEMPMNIADLL